MDIRKYIFTVSVFLAAFVPASVAQTIDPTVEVSRTYVGKLMEVHKPVLKMYIPDSVETFDLDFDYSVFDSPYNGVYEFNPYLPSMRPEPSAGTEKSFFMRAGAGYPVHPVFDLVWSPLLKGCFRMDVYGSHRSYIGRYRHVSPSVAEPGLPSVIEKSGSKAFNGYDMQTEAGVSGRVDWDKGVFSFDAGYRGFHLKDTVATRGYDAFKAGFRVRSENSREKYFMYDISAEYLYGEDKLDYAVVGKKYMSEHDFSLNASLGQVFSDKHRALLDIDMDIASYGHTLDSYSGRMSLVPKYVFTKKRWSLDLGVRFSVFMKNDFTGGLYKMHSGKSQFVYPDIDISFNAIRDHLDIYLDLGGGNNINSYYDMLCGNRHLTPYYTGIMSAGPSMINVLPLLDNTVERVSASFGFRGNIRSRLEYDLKALYSNYANAPLYAMMSAPSYISGTMAYTGYQTLGVSLDCRWTSEDVTFGGTFNYRHTILPEDGFSVKLPAPDAYADVFFFRPPAFSGYADIKYNWRKRIYAGVDCGFSTGMKGAAYAVPSYADLGVVLEFKAARMLSFWVRGGNLLDMTIQRTPMYAESGINFTAGICLNL